jgi:glycosyltransferase involved in cell wall biosynthesis
MVSTKIMEVNSLNGPLVSVIIPTYNSEKSICETIRSVISQSYQNLEIIVVNDGSTDSTMDKINEAFSDKRILLISQSNKGASAARNLGLQSSNGTWIKFLDSDDLINPEMVSRQMTMAIEHPASVISGEWGRFYNNDLSTFKLSPEPCWETMNSIDWLCASWSNGSSMTNPGIFLIPRQLILNSGLWNENLSLLDDADFFSRTILSSENVVFTPGSILYYRSGVPGNLSSLRSKKGFISMYYALQQTITAITSRRNDIVTRQLAANILQLFIYTAYPRCPDLIKKAEKQIKNLATPTLRFPAGRLEQKLARVVGWKLVKCLRRY